MQLRPVRGIVEVGVVRGHEAVVVLEMEGEVRVARISARAVDDVGVVGREVDVLDAVELVELLHVDHELRERRAPHPVVALALAVVDRAERRPVAARGRVDAIAAALVAVTHVEPHEGPPAHLRELLRRRGPRRLLGSKEESHELRGPPEVAAMRVRGRHVGVAVEIRHLRVVHGPEVVGLRVVAHVPAGRVALDDVPELRRRAAEHVVERRVLDAEGPPPRRGPGQRRHEPREDAADAHAPDAREADGLGARPLLRRVQLLLQRVGLDVARRPRRAEGRQVLAEARDVVREGRGDAGHGRPALRGAGEVPRAPAPDAGGLDVLAPVGLGLDVRRRSEVGRARRGRGPAHVGGHGARLRPRTRREAALEVARGRPRRQAVRDRRPLDADPLSRLAGPGRQAVLRRRRALGPGDDGGHSSFEVGEDAGLLDGGRRPRRRGARASARRVDEGPSTRRRVDEGPEQASHDERARDGPRRRPPPRSRHRFRVLGPRLGGQGHLDGDRFIATPPHLDAFQHGCAGFEGG